MASVLGVPTVEVHLGLGEAMAQVKRSGWPDDPEHELTYLTEEEMEAAVQGAPGSDAAGLRLGPVRGSKPSFDDDDVRRIQTVLQQVCAEAMGEGGENVLLVTHGDVVAQMVEMTTRETVLECEYCGWAVVGAQLAQDPAAAEFERLAQDGVSSVAGDW